MNSERHVPARRRAGPVTAALGAVLSTVALLAPTTARAMVSCPIDWTTAAATASAPAPTTAGVKAGARTYQWGSAVWREPSLGCALMSQTFDFWPAAGPVKTVYPTIVYFHATGSTSHVKSTSVVYQNLIGPAIAQGYNVVSVEYRHPTGDQYLAVTNNGQVFHQDVGLVIQYLRANAATFHISTRNLFAFGHSRGTLSLWQALQPDMGGLGTGLPSSKVSAVFGYQPQTTYQCDEFANLFLLPGDPSTLKWVQSCKKNNPYWPQFGSAISSVTVDSPPVMLQYQMGFELVPGSQTEIQPVSIDYLKTTYGSTDHYPDQGIALYDAYLAVGNANMFYPQAWVDSAHQFLGWQDFVTPYLVPDDGI